MSLSTGSVVGIVFGALGSILVTYYLIAIWLRVIEERTQDEKRKRVHATRRHTKAVTRDLEAGGGTAAPGGRNLKYAHKKGIRAPNRYAGFSTSDLDDDTETSYSTQDSMAITSDLENDSKTAPKGRGA